MAKKRKEFTKSVDPFFEALGDIRESLRKLGRRRF